MLHFITQQGIDISKQNKTIKLCKGEYLEMGELDFEPTNLEEAYKIAMSQLKKDNGKLTYEEIVTIKNMFHDFMNESPSFQDIEDYICKYWENNTKWMVYALFQEFLYNYSYNYEEMLDLWMRLYVMDIYSEDAVDDLEYLWQQEENDDWDKTKVTIYRGVNVLSAETDRALSWTTDKEIAYWFACRTNQDSPRVLTGEVEKGAIIKEYNGRKEREVVVLPDYVSIIQEEDVTYSEDEIARISDKERKL